MIGRFQFEQSAAPDAIPKHDVPRCCRDATLANIQWSESSLIFVGWTISFAGRLHVGRSKPHRFEVRHVWSIKGSGETNNDFSCAKMIMCIISYYNCPYTKFDRNESHPGLPKVFVVCSRSGEAQDLLCGHICCPQTRKSGATAATFTREQVRAHWTSRQPNSPPEPDRDRIDVHSHSWNWRLT